MTEDDLDVRKGSERPQEDLLPRWMARISRACGYTGREILDSMNGVFGQEQFAQLVDVQPLIWRAFDGTIVEVESVDVDDRLHGDFPEKAEAGPQRGAASRLAPEGTRGV